MTEKGGARARGAHAEQGGARAREAYTERSPVETVPGAPYTENNAPAAGVNDTDVAQAIGTNAGHTPVEPLLGAPYAYNDAPEPGTLADVLEHAAERFSDRVAFEWADGRRSTYAQLAEHAAAARRALDATGTGGVATVEAGDPFDFAVGFFAAAASGRVALLGSTGALAGIGADDLPEGTAVVLSSSGTGGIAKAVALGGAGIVADLVAGLELLSFEPGDRAVVLLPPTHAFGLVCDILGVLATGGTLCIPTGPRAAIAQLAYFSPTVMNAPPRFARTLRDLVAAGTDARALIGGRLRRILVGGAGLDAPTSRDLRAVGIEALGCYGLSECSPCVAVNRDRWHRDASAGIPLRCNEVLVDVGGDLIEPRPGTATPVGELCVRGANVMLGYPGRADLTARVLRDGLLHTADLGFFDTDGFLHVLGRTDGIAALGDGTKRVVPATSWKE